MQPRPSQEPEGKGLSLDGESDSKINALNEQATIWHPVEPDLSDNPTYSLREPETNNAAVVFSSLTQMVSEPHNRFLSCWKRCEHNSQVGPKEDDTSQHQKKRQMTEDSKGKADKAVLKKA